MVLKEKKPKKPSLFEIIKGSIKDPNKEKNDEENIVFIFYFILYYFF